MSTMISEFKTREENENFQKYLRTKFARACLGLFRNDLGDLTASVGAVQTAPPLQLPIQDFTSKSDIDWSKPVHEIDNQLFDKYGVPIPERIFIKFAVPEFKETEPVAEKVVTLEEVLARLKFRRLLIDLMKLAQFADVEEQADKLLMDAGVELLAAPEEVDAQFYKRYGFTPAMIEFVERRYSNDNGSGRVGGSEETTR